MLRNFDCLVPYREVVLGEFVRFLGDRRFAYSRAVDGAILIPEGQLWWSDRFKSVACFTQVINPASQEATKSALYLQFNNPNNSTDDAWDRVWIDEDEMFVRSAEGDLRWSLELIKE